MIITEIFVDHKPDTLIIAEIQGETDKYNVSFVDGIYFCNCCDFHYRSGFSEYLDDKIVGKKVEQYKCKHINFLENYLLNYN